MASEKGAAEWRVCGHLYDRGSGWSLFLLSFLLRVTRRGGDHPLDDRPKGQILPHDTGVVFRCAWNLVNVDRLPRPRAGVSQQPLHFRKSAPRQPELSITLTQKQRCLGGEWAPPRLLRVCA